MRRESPVFFTLLAHAEVIIISCDACVHVQRTIITWVRQVHAMNIQVCLLSIKFGIVHLLGAEHSGGRRCSLGFGVDNTHMYTRIDVPY